LLKDKLVRLGEFDRLIHQRQGERAEDARRAKRIAKARAVRAATTRTPRVVDDGVQVGRYLTNRQGLFLLKCGGRGAQPLKLPLANLTARITAEIRRDDRLACYALLTRDNVYLSTTSWQGPKCAPV
jgi:hypothetical protein